MGKLLCVEFTLYAGTYHLIAYRVNSTFFSNVDTTVVVRIGRTTELDFTICSICTERHPTPETPPLLVH